MLEKVKSFLKEEDGLGTVEIAIIVAVLVGVALIFRKALTNMVNQVIASTFSNGTDATSAIGDSKGLSTVKFGE